ncbi:MAG: NADP-dependent malic enzyme [Patescibacteria group bacterium]
MNYSHHSIQKHGKHKGKIGIVSYFPLKTKEDLSIAYTPGVAAVSRHIAENPKAARTHTMKGRMIAVISDGSAILGLGNLGPEAALPVMEGKCALFKAFAGVDAFPIVLGTQDTEEIIAAVKAIAPTFGGINLEDISGPRCFEIEERLKKELPIPVFHDDQHGTAIVVFAALINALKVVKKKLGDVRIVINGAGAAATATTKFLVFAGANPKNIRVLDTKGILTLGREHMSRSKDELAKLTNPKGERGNLKDALENADVFIGMSAKNVLIPEWVDGMAEKPIVFALANPDPEIDPKSVKKTKIAVFGTGRSDLPNQINNVLAFPGIFRGALDADARQITDEMKLAAAKAIASLVPAKKLSATYIVPDPFDKRVALAVARAVKKVARK